MLLWLSFSIAYERHDPTMRTCEAPSEPKMVVSHSLLVAYSLKCMWLHSSDINLIMQLPLTIPIIPTRSQWGRYAHISSSYFLCSAISDVSTLSYSWIVKSKTVVTSLVISYIISSCIYIYAMPFIFICHTFPQLPPCLIMFRSSSLQAIRRPAARTRSQIFMVKSMPTFLLARYVWASSSLNDLNVSTLW